MKLLYLGKVSEHRLLGLFFEKNLTLSDGAVFVCLSAFMKACTFMFMVVNGHHEGYLSTFFEFFKNSNFWCLAAILQAKFAQNLKFSKSRRGNFL